LIDWQVYLDAIIMIQKYFC